MQAKARMQINLMLSKVDDIKQVAGITEMAFPLFWFESVSGCRPCGSCLSLFFACFDVWFRFFSFRELTTCRTTWWRN